MPAKPGEAREAKLKPGDTGYAKQEANRIYGDLHSTSPSQGSIGRILEAAIERVIAETVSECARRRSP